jgi:hypothetical protein
MDHLGTGTEEADASVPIFVLRYYEGNYGRRHSKVVLAKLSYNMQYPGNKFDSGHVQLSPTQLKTLRGLPPVLIAEHSPYKPTTSAIHAV